MTTSACARLCSFCLLVVVCFALLAQEPPRPPPSPSPSRRHPESDTTPDASPTPRDPMSTPTFNGLRLRSIGPAFTSGRISGFAVDPSNRRATTSRSPRAACGRRPTPAPPGRRSSTTKASYSIGAIALDPKNPLTVWVGTGENNSQRSVRTATAFTSPTTAAGPGGTSASRLRAHRPHRDRSEGLEHRLRRAQGPLWGPGGERGLFKTTDGGKTWKKILNISENTGVTDVVIDPNDPNTIYALRISAAVTCGRSSTAARKARSTNRPTRRDLEQVASGFADRRPRTHRSRHLAGRFKRGLRHGRGRRSPWRNLSLGDRGGSWERRNEFDATAMYYSRIVADPKDVDRIYVMNVFLMVSDDGGRTLRRLGERNKHVDNHDIWIDPRTPITTSSAATAASTRASIAARTGTSNRTCRSRSSTTSPPTTRSRSTTSTAARRTTSALVVHRARAALPASPTPTGSSRTAATVFVRKVDPKIRTSSTRDRRTAVSCASTNARANASAFNRSRAAAKIRCAGTGTRRSSSARTHTRVSISRPTSCSQRRSRRHVEADQRRLSRAARSRQAAGDGQGLGHRRGRENASTAFFGNASALAESPKKEGLIYVGTDDGLVQVTEDGGKNWRKIEKFPGVPDMSYVSRIIASNHDANTAYVSFDNHQNGDFKPYLLKTTDAAERGRRLSANLPKNGPVLAIAEDHVNPNLLFAGTEFGLFFSIDGGQKWIQLKGGMPTIAVRDLNIQKRENDLVVGTFGRGIYILDDYTPLRLLKPEMLRQEAAVFPVKDALMYIQSQPLGGRGKSFQGERSTRRTIRRLARR